MQTRGVANARKSEARQTVANTCKWDSTADAGLQRRRPADMPHGWVFHEAENAAGYAKSVGELKFDLNQNHSSLAYVAWGPNGLKYD
jgi:hypothetical protein